MSLNSKLLTLPTRLKKSLCPYFLTKTLNRILEYVTTKTNKAQLKQIGVHGILFVRDIKSMEALLEFLGKMHGFVTEKV